MLYLQLKCGSLTLLPWCRSWEPLVRLWGRTAQSPQRGNREEAGLKICLETSDLVLAHAGQHVLYMPHHRFFRSNLRATYWSPLLNCGGVGNQYCRDSEEVMADQRASDGEHWARTRFPRYVGIQHTEKQTREASQMQVIAEMVKWHRIILSCHLVVPMWLFVTILALDIQLQC